MSKSLTKKQQYWLDHSKAADSSHLSFSAYAKQHELNIQAFYNYRNILREKGLIAINSNKPKPLSFIQVLQKNTPATTHVKPIVPLAIKLPNGLQIDISHNESDITRLVERLMTL